MSILLLALIVLSIGLIASVFILKEDSGTQGDKKDKNLLSVFGLGSKAAAAAKQPTKQPAESDNLSLQLNKAKEDFQKLYAELQEAKKKEAALNDELKMMKASLERDSSSQGSLAKENAELKEKLAKKDQEFHEQFSLNLKLGKESEEFKGRIKEQENNIQQSAERGRVLEAQNKAYQEELEKQKQITQEFKSKIDESQWVSKKEYDLLKAKVEEKNKGADAKG